MKSNGKSKSTFRLLNRKVLRSLKDNYKQYLAILMISFLAVCLFNGLTSNADLLNRRVENLYEKGNIADLFLTISPYSYQDDIIEIKDLDSNISEINARGNIQANYQQSSLNLLVNSDDNTISVPIVIDGDENFMITDSFAEANNLKIGDEMLLEITNPLLQSEEFEKYINLLPLVLKPNQENVLAETLIQISFTISGIMYFPEAVASSQFSDTYIYSQFSYVYNILKDFILSHYNLESYLNYVTSQQIYNLLVNQILIKTSNVERSKDIINKYYASKETNNLLLLIDLENLPSNSQVMQDVNQSKKLTYVFPTIFFLVSILIISTTLSQLILKERLQIGAMKSLGIKKSLIYLHYMTYGFIVCLLGGLIGFIVGPLTLPKVMELKYALLWDMPQLSSKLFLPLNIVSIIVILALALLISFIVIRKSVSEKPVDLLKNVAPKTKVNLFNNARHLSLTTKMSFRNILANKVKSLMIILGTLGCTALLDAVGNAVTHIRTIHKYAREEDQPEKTVFVITTDGEENSSREFTYRKVKELIERQQKDYGWDFLFLGANIDAGEEAAKIGIAPEQAVRYECDSTGTLLNFNVLGEAMCSLREGKKLNRSWKRDIEKYYGEKKR